MTEQIGNVTVNYEYYEGQDFYSDGDVEDEILDIVKTYPANEFTTVVSSYVQIISEAIFFKVCQLIRMMRYWR